MNFFMKNYMDSVCKWILEAQFTKMLVMVMYSITDLHLKLCLLIYDFVFCLFSSSETQMKIQSLRFFMCLFACRHMFLEGETCTSVSECMFIQVVVSVWHQILCLSNSTLYTDTRCLWSTHSSDWVIMGRQISIDAEFLCLAFTIEITGKSPSPPSIYIDARNANFSPYICIAATSPPEPSPQSVTLTFNMYHITFLHIRQIGLFQG